MINASRRPHRRWFSFWTAPTLRFAYIAVAFAAFVWPFVVATGVLRQAYGFPLRRAVGATMASAGVTLGLLAGLVAAIGVGLSLRYRRQTAPEASAH